MKLYVLGNGFDIGHKIPCKYLDFYNYLEENRRDILEIMGKYYHVGCDSDLWSDFESSLEEGINYDSLAEIVWENTPNFTADDFSDGDWYNAQIYIEQDCEKLLENIRSGFEEWVESLQISDVKKVYKLDLSAFFITFNYTEILEKVYKIPISNILHIHNKVGEKLVFGHGKKSEDFNVKKALYGDEKAFLDIDEDGNIESSEVGHEMFAENEVCAFYEKMRKHTEKIIPTLRSFISSISNIDEVIIIGHSYNEIDFPYFEEIGKIIDSNTKWILHYFSEKDKKSAEAIMNKLKIKYSQIKYEHCSEIEISDTQLKLFLV